MNRHRFTYLSRTVLLISLVMTFTACVTPTPPASSGSSEAPTQAPAATQAPAGQQPPNIVVALPAQDVDTLKLTASQKLGAGLPDLATEHTVIYALPSSGIAFLLTPVQAGLRDSAKDLETLAAENKIDATQILGGLTVRQDKVTELPPGDYVITLASDGNTVKFTSLPGIVMSFSAVIRSLPLALPADRPVALITSSQMCLAWVATQVCALIQTPLSSDLRTQVATAINDLGANPNDFALDRAIPDIEGSGMLQKCAEALDATPPLYSACTATVLAAPAIKSGSFPTPPTNGGSTPPAQTIEGIGVLLTLEPVADQVYADPDLTEVVGTLPQGNYLTYVLLPDGWQPNPNEPTATRVLQAGPAGRFYMPSVSGGEIIGDPVLGIGPSNDEEAIIVNLWIARHCYCKARQCPWLQ